MKDTGSAAITLHPHTIRVALAGCGVVGSSLVHLLAEREASLADRQGIRFELVRVLVREPDRPRPVELAPPLLTSNLDEFLATEADLVVELLGGLEPAERIARATLTAGRRLVSANKALIAARGAELAALARRHGGTLDFEGAVGGGIPLIRALRESLPETGIQSLRGILNGTSNFILTRLAEGNTYTDALADAQRAGFAEADPSRDLDGRDADDKLRILAWLAFGVDPATVTVRRQGILPNPERLARAAATFGAVVRHVAECAELDGGLTASVAPVAVTPESDLGRIRDVENLLLVQTRWNGCIRLAGPGAGGFATASAVLADMIRAGQPLAPGTLAPGTLAPGTRPPTPRATGPGACPDPRAHHWIVGGDGAATRTDLLLRLLERGGIEVREQRHDTTGAAWLHTTACRTDTIERVLAPVAGAGGEPLALRFAG